MVMCIVFHSLSSTQCENILLIKIALDFSGLLEPKKNKLRRKQKAMKIEY